LIKINLFTLKNTKKIGNLVDQILVITSHKNYNPKNPSAEQKELEKKIDEMVFNLYGLTYEERVVILES
jgi:hypothetical protein